MFHQLAAERRRLWRPLITSAALHALLIYGVVKYQGGFWAGELPGIPASPGYRQKWRRWCSGWRARTAVGDMTASWVHWDRRTKRSRRGSDACSSTDARHGKTLFV